MKEKEFFHKTAVSGTKNECNEETGKMEERKQNKQLYDYNVASYPYVKDRDIKDKLKSINKFQGLESEKYNFQSEYKYNLDLMEKSLW